MSYYKSLADKHDLVNGLDYLVSSLRNETSDSLKSLQGLVHYLTKIKNPLNVSLVLSEFLNSPAIFKPISNLIGYTTYDIDHKTTLLIIDAFRVSTTRKSVITDPTIDLDTYLNQIITTCQSQNSPRCLPVLCGVLLALSSGSVNPSPKHSIIIEELITHIINDTIANVWSMSSYEISPNRTCLESTVLSLSQVFVVLGDKAKSSLNHSRLVSLMVPFIFLSGSRYLEETAVTAESQPVFQNLSNHSLIIQYCLRKIGLDDWNILDETLNQIYSFGTDISAKVCESQIILNEVNWKRLKSILFSIIIVLNPYSEYFLHNINPRYEAWFLGFSSKIMRILYEVSFIVDKVGAGGFSVYQFIYSSCLDILLNPKLIGAQRDFCQELGYSLSGQINFSQVIFFAYEDQMVERLVEYSKILFVLNYFEHLVKYCTVDFKDNIILPICRLFLIPPSHFNSEINYDKSLSSKLKPIIESSHSVILSMISSSVFDLQNNKLLSSFIPEYLNIIHEKRLFPDVFSYNQYLLIVDTLVKTCSIENDAFFYFNPKLYLYILDKIEGRLKSIAPGEPLLRRAILSGNESNGQGEVVSDHMNPPPTIRSAVLLSLINAASYVEPIGLIDYLDKLWYYINLYSFDSKVSPSVGLKFSSNEKLPDSRILTEEKGYLVDCMWKMISGELDQQRASMAIDWWYRLGLVNRKSAKI
ncbi:hypothetical protein NADFUDRAFT_50611 [Nadsonia fulvescens var. elongata DSM 6958]|uniref:Uncharacterized protein n=1 Tax=Nadsonia fulvescens var. elongata DSM 6958 TaxID=857566 RepID=A0A1E3PN30_9ASCO|nr:hypothetical protein NADFUDRAFT_50611 [Nadsonia fulvescens var. elongata DSM 6958]